MEYEAKIDPRTHQKLKPDDVVKALSEVVPPGREAPVCVCLCVDVCMCVHMQMYVHVHMYVRLCAFVCVCVCAD